ncbi:tetratricopeptide repeat protein [uncultured Treponema sp.]|uniref:tetratricopeptide repeat protein n=1 Tax=uncultured Treponema sp. TaxID=162155 RepID=UPI00258AB79C|nr:tetratricopeptide repeat protein [uncultured Treponema sp.]
MSYLIAGVIMIALVAVLTLFMGKNGGGSTKDKKTSNRNKAQIIKEANKKLAKNPHDPAGLIPLGDVYFSSQIWDKAYLIYNDLSKLDSKSGFVNLDECFLRLGISALQLGKNPEAVQALVSAYKINSVSFENNFYLGKAMFNQKLYEKSVPLFKKAILAKPESTGVYFLLAQSLYFAKKYRECLSFFKKALDEDPSNKEALFNMSDAMFQEGRGDRAIKIFMHLRADPVYGARSCLRAGIFHTKINDLNSAIQDYEIGLKHENEPSDIRVEIEYNLARCYFEKNQIAKGLALLKAIRNSVQNYKDVNSLINRYQELSQNNNMQIYISANSNDFVTLCRKFILTKYKNSNVKIQNIEKDSLYTDILTEIFAATWQDVVLFRFFRTTGSVGEIYIREFHEHMNDVNAERGFCVSAGIFSEESKKYIEGRPIDLIEKTELTKILKQISI